MTVAKNCPPDCDKEWRDARQKCMEELSKPNPAPSVTGGYKDIENCARGLVSAACGGNPVSYQKRGGRRGQSLTE